MSQDFMKEKIYWTAQDIEKLLACTNNERDWLLIYLMFRSGRRVSEVLQFKPEHIDRQAKKIKWFILKKRIPNYTELHEVDSDTWNILLEYIRKYDIAENQFIFFSSLNPLRPISYDRAYAIIRRTAEKAGFEMMGSHHPHPHLLRHSYAINYIRNSPNPAEAILDIKKDLSHQNANETMIYMDFVENKGKTERLDIVFGKKKLPQP